MQQKEEQLYDHLTKREIPFAMYIEIDSFLTVGMNTSTPHGPTMRKDYGFSIRIRLWKKEKQTHSPQSV